MRVLLMVAVLSSAVCLAQAEAPVKSVDAPAAPTLKAPVGAPAEVEWVTSFEAARRQAAERKVPILADFSGSDWCGWCIKLDEEVFSKKAFKDYARENLVLFLADFPRRKPQAAELKEQNRKLSGQYGIEGFPTVLLLDATGKELARTGYRPGGAEGYVTHLKSLRGGK